MKLKEKPQLWNELNKYIERSKSTGCSWSDYWELYSAVRTRKPKEILECGPGVSTMIMSYALMENQNEGYPGRITALEEVEPYYQMAVDLLPNYLRSFVEFNLSPRIEDYYSIFRGVRYRDTPHRAYDFVFVDGPDLNAPSDGSLTFDLDYIHIVKNSQNPVYGIVDYRLSTSYVFQVVFGLHKVKFSALRELAFIGPCTKDDLTQLDLRALTATFRKNARILGNTELKLR